MAIIVESIIIKNRAPFESLNLTFKEKGVSVLTAFNGKGKTTILSYIVDAWIEITKGAYDQSYAGKTTSYYRVSSPLYDLANGKTSLVYIRFKTDHGLCDYLDLRNGCDPVLYEQTISLQNAIPYEEIKKAASKKDAFKYVSRSFKDKEMVRKVFDNNIITFFPAFRYEIPNYLNELYQEGFTFKKDLTFNGYMINPLEVRTDIRDIANWLMDVVLDWEINPNKITLPGGKNADVTPERQLWLNAKAVLEQALISKFPEKNVRFGIGKRSNPGSRLSIMQYDVANPNVAQMYCPSIFNLSSGELAILSIFCELLRQGDNVYGPIPLQQFYGIVLIDEVDKHLHIKLQKEVLPHLFELFPNIQFIVSSHSPFLNMGLATTCSSRAVIYDLDNGGIVSSPTTNNVYEEAYNTFMGEKNEYAKRLAEANSIIEKTTKPIIITEGKTDILILQKAALEIGVNLDVEWKEFGGDTQSKAVCENVAKFMPVRKVIAIYDHDSDKFIKEYPNRYNVVAGNVYSFCIPIPQSRLDSHQNKVSLEYYFSDDEIHTKMDDGRSLFFGKDFTESGRCIFDKNLLLVNQEDRGKDKIVESTKGQKVVGLDESINLLATKNSFAEAVSQDKISISKESWDNFKCIFEIINEILLLPS